MHLSPRRTRLARTACVLAALATVSAAPAPAATAAQAGHKIFLDDGFDGAEIKPDHMTLLGPAQVFLVRLHWSSWGGRTANATGTWGRHDCRTGCGSGPLIDRHPVRVVLSQRRLCPKNGVLPQPTRYYLRRTITFTRSVPKGSRRRVVAGFGCPQDFGVKHPRSATPVGVKGLSSGVAALSAGDSHACAQNTAGALECWGYNDSGQLGDGTEHKRPGPAAVQGLSGPVSQVSAGNLHTCAVTAAGAALCWGYNGDGELGDGTTTDRRTPTPVSGLGSGVTAISAGTFHTCALTTAGAVSCWGYDDEINGAPISPAHTRPVPVSGLDSGVVAISAGNRFSCALTDAGAVKCWGLNDEGQLGNGTKTHSSQPVAVQGLGSGVVAISAGNAHACAVTGQGALMCWGANDDGELGDGTKTSRSAPGVVDGLGTGVLAVSAGSTHSCAILSDRTATCWGTNDAGELGNGTFKAATRPVAVSGLTGIAGLGAGTAFTCAVTTEGAAKCWGDNGIGQLGIGAF